MNVTVDGQTIPESAIAAEAEFHADSEDPHHCAAVALVIRRLIVERARAHGMLDRDERQPEDVDLDDALDALLALEANVPEPEEQELQNFYNQNPGLFEVGEKVHAAHILFAVTTTRIAEALQIRAQAALDECIAQPERFAVLAAKLSNCPTGQYGGDLGWLGRGEAVPEFDRILFSGREPGFWPRPVATRFGWHVIRIIEQEAGTTLPFEAARAEVAAHVRSRCRRKAGAQYLKRLAANAHVQGIKLRFGASWLMQ